MSAPVGHGGAGADDRGAGADDGGAGTGDGGAGTDDRRPGTSGLSASIDDLLQHEEEPPSSRRLRRRSGAGWWIRTGLWAAALTAVAVLGLLMVGVRVSAVLLFAGFLTLFVLRRVVAQVAAPPAPRARSGNGADGSDDGRSPDALRSAVRRWEARLDWSQTDDERFSRILLPVLGELTDERLRQRHGLTRASDPRRARELIGEPLWRLLSQPGRRPRARELAAHVETLEKL